MNMSPVQNPISPGIKSTTHGESRKNLGTQVIVLRILAEWDGKEYLFQWTWLVHRMVYQIFSRNMYCHLPIRTTDGRRTGASGIVHPLHSAGWTSVFFRQKWPSVPGGPLDLALSAVQRVAHGPEAGAMTFARIGPAPPETSSLLDTCGLFSLSCESSRCRQKKEFDHGGGQNSWQPRIEHGVKKCSNIDWQTTVHIEDDSEIFEQKTTPSSNWSLWKERNQEWALFLAERERETMHGIYTNMCTELLKRMKIWSRVSLNQTQKIELPLPLQWTEKRGNLLSTLVLKCTRWVRTTELQKNKKTNGNLKKRPYHWLPMGQYGRRKKVGKYWGDRSRDSHERLQPFNEEMLEGASSSTDDAPRAVVDTIPPPAISPLTHTSARPSSYKPGGNISFFQSFSKDPNCEICKRTKITRACCKRSSENRAERIPEAEKCGDSVTADHNILDEENEPRLQQIRVVVVQDSVTQSIQSYPRTNRTARELVKLCKDLKWIHEKSTPHRSNQTTLRKEQYTE